MNILVIGNGFDLAHGLPTRWADFLEFCKVIRNSDNLEDSFFEFKQCIASNFWIDYFMSIIVEIGGDWTDFENEISRIIISLDSDMQNNGNKYELDHYVERLSNNFMNSLYIDGTKEQKTFRVIRKYLLNDLNRLIRALEIYLIKFVENVCIKKKIKYIEEINPCFVLSFNYTYTYARVYGGNKDVEYSYVHGSIIRDYETNRNNMVLGIDEDFDNKEDENTEFIAFKKYYQRILKETGNEYKRWIDLIKNSRKDIELVYRGKYPVQIPYSKFKNRHKVYFFGYSLDSSDKDIFREILLSDNVYTTIFCLDKKDLRRKIANLVKAIGQDELIRRTGGSTKTIEFKLQQDMVERV